LLEGLVFGARIAEHIAGHLTTQLVPRSTEQEPTLLLDPAIRIPLQLAMSEGSGVMRSEKSLRATLATLAQLGTHASEKPDVNAWEVSNLFFLATAIVRSALERKETRGSHWRSDFPESSNEWKVRIIQKLLSDGNWLTRAEAVNE
jgi:L-aspartate oxidase